MDRKEAQIRLEGANDLIILFLKTMRNIGIMVNKPMSKEDYEHLLEMLKGLKSLLAEKYESEIKFEEEMK
ncbi:MAG: hypothetical protein QXY62_05910 [Candidatus Altiarchaeota archaeon]